MMEKIAIIMPVYNEEAAVGAVLDKWVAAMDKLGIDYTINPYNDGSKDNSLKVIEAKAAQYPGKVIAHTKNNGGHGPTILLGYCEAAKAGYDWVFQIDSDDEMGPDGFPELWNQRDKYDFLVGIRDGRKQALPRKIISAVSRLSVRIFYGKSVWDVNTPYRLMRVSAFKDVWEKIPSDTFAPNVIISGMAARLKMRCFETRVPQKDRQTGEVSIKKWKLFKAAAKSFFQTIEFALSRPQMLFLFLLLAFFSLVGKILLSYRGFNYDYESYKIVAEIMKKGGNVYAETYRYNYAPGWFNILHFCDICFDSYFRYAIITLLSLADIGIAWLLWFFNRRIAAVILLLSPVALHISGFHNQFDNIAILCAFISIYILSSRKKLSFYPIWFSGILMGISLVIKHVFVFFPIWVIFRKTDIRTKLILLFLPYIIFGLSFLPYIFSGVYNYYSVSSSVHADMLYLKNLTIRTTRYTLKNMKNKSEIKRYLKLEKAELKKYLGAEKTDALRPLYGIIKNVFRYRSFNNKIFHSYILPPFIARYIPAFLLFLLGVIGSGFIFRKQSAVDCFLLYTAVLVIFSSAITDQYLAIPLAFAAYLYYPFGILYHFIIGLSFLATCPECFHEKTYIIAVLLLCCMVIQYIRIQMMSKQ